MIFFRQYYDRNLIKYLGIKNRESLKHPIVRNRSHDIIHSLYPFPKLPYHNRSPLLPKCSLKYAINSIQSRLTPNSFPLSPDRQNRNIYKEDDG